MGTGSRKSLAATILTLGFISLALAGYPHEGTAKDKGEAIAAANAAAREAAATQESCWKAAVEKDCRQKDGYWTCVAYTPNHKTGCGEPGYRKP